MKQYTHIITDPLGIHARPAGQLVKVAGGFLSSIQLACNGQEADAKRIIGVMKMAAKQGMELSVTCEGEDEEAAMVAVEAFLKETL